MYVRFCEILKTAFVVYTIRQLNPIPIHKAKLYYILFLSPLLLTKSLVSNNDISHNYRKFLFNFSYPENTFKQETIMKNCRDLHSKSTPDGCIESFKKNFHITIQRVLKMYSRLYCLHGIVLFLITKKLYKFINPRLQTNISTRSIVKSECLNTLRSTAFLAGQTLLQRILLCIRSSSMEKLNAANIYLLSILGAIPIYFERPFRVQQVNNLVMSHLIVGQMKKYNMLQSQLPLCMFLSTILCDSLTFRTIIFFISLVTSATF